MGKPLAFLGVGGGFKQKQGTEDAGGEVGASDRAAAKLLEEDGGVGQGESFAAVFGGNGHTEPAQGSGALP